MATPAPRTPAPPDPVPVMVVGPAAGRSRSGLRSLGLVRRVGWGIADQGISSLGNFVLGIIVARSLGSAGFGAFSLAYVTFSFVLNASRGTSTDPLLVRFSGAGDAEGRRAGRAVTATALVEGFLFGLGCVGVGLAVGGEVGAGFVALGFGLPGILLQDSYRFVYFAAGRGHRAFVNDLVWAVLQVSVVLTLFLTGSATVVSCLLAFGGTATVAAVVAMVDSRVVPGIGLVRAWLVDHRDLGLRYLAENVSIGGARQLRMFAVGAVAGLVPVGEIRATEILMGPFFVLLSGVSQVAVPEAREVLRRAPGRLGRFCLVMGLVPAVAAAAWGAAILAVLPLGPGRMLLGELWTPASTLIVPVTVFLLTACFHNAFTAAVRALGNSRRSLAAQLWNAGLYLLCGGVGAELNGAQGSSWGLVLAGVVGAAIWWYEFRRALAEHRPEEPMPAVDLV